MKRLMLFVMALSLSQTLGHWPPQSRIETATVGVNFFLPLKREMFFNSTHPESKHGLRYVVSTLGRPDLPEWLRIVHKRNTEPAYMYGTPSSVHNTTTIKITAIDRNTNLISQRTQNISVSQLPDQARYFVDLTVRNLDIGELFAHDLLNDVLMAMRRIWPTSGNIYITRVSTLSEVGERLPVPESPADKTAIKDGVRIQVGGTGDFSNSLKRVKEELRGACEPGQMEPNISIDHRFQPDFDIDWCKYKLITHDMLEPVIPVTPTPAPILLTGYDMGAMSDDVIPRRDFSDDFFATVVFPILLALVVGIVLSVFFFCIRQGTERRDELTPDTQLSQFNTIRRATTNLRLMSQRRDGPPPLSPSPQPAHSIDESITPVHYEEAPTADNLSLTLVSHTSTSPHHSGADNMAQL